MNVLLMQYLYAIHLLRSMIQHPWVSTHIRPCCQRCRVHRSATVVCNTTCTKEILCTSTYPFPHTNNMSHNDTKSILCTSIHMYIYGSKLTYGHAVGGDAPLLGLVLARQLGVVHCHVSAANQATVGGHLHSRHNSDGHSTTEQRAKRGAS
jgi:hypothetical protein